jgi:hypothetical protein
LSQIHNNPTPQTILPAGSAESSVAAHHSPRLFLPRSHWNLKARKNTRKREVSMQQLLTHVHDVIVATIPSIKSWIVGGDFNTNKDQEMFATEQTLEL